MNEASVKTKSPFHLQRIRVASPCSANWERMTGDDRIRCCAECRLNVYNLSALRVGEIEQLVMSREGRLCGRFYRRLDGTILTQDCPSQVRTAVRRISRLAGAVLSAAMSVNFAIAQTPARNMSSLVQLEQKGEISLVVTDETGAVVPNAGVSLINQSNRKQQDGMTDSTGRFRQADLDIGSYVLTVGWPGFETERRLVSLTEGQVVEVQVTLKVAPLMGVVVVSESADVEPQLESIAPQLRQIDQTEKPVPHSNFLKKLFLSIRHRL